MMDANEPVETLSVLQKLLDASASPNPHRKRASSCPPRFDDFIVSDLAAELDGMEIVEPQSDPIALDVDMTNVTVENAQTLLDPSACIFVGK